MTITIDLIDNGVLSLLRDMERLNLIRVNPPTEKPVAGKKILRERNAESSTPLTDRLSGILSHVKDTSPQDIREERLNKYL
jgi:hypothetical protein